MRLLRISGDHVEVIPERSYRDRDVGGFGESTLQELLVAHPEIIPSEEMDADDPPRFMVIKAEAGVTLGSLDILMIDQKGVPTAVEVKLVDNREMRRMVLAQGVEYLAHLQGEWTPERMLEEGQAFWSERKSNFETESQKRLGIPFDGEFTERIAANLDGNRLRLIIAGDRIPSELRTVIEYLNEASIFEVYGLEVRLCATGEESDLILAPQLVGFTQRAQERKRSRTSTRWDKERFFTALAETSPPEEVALAEDLMAFGIEVTGRGVEWGTGRDRGSLTARLVVNGERFSLFSIYTTGQFSVNIGWSHEKFERLGTDLSEKYRSTAKDRVSVDFDQTNWERGWPMAELSALTRDSGADFKELIRNFVSEIQDLSEKISNKT